MDIDFGARTTFFEDIDSDCDTGMDNLSDSVMKAKDTLLTRYTLTYTYEKAQEHETLTKHTHKIRARACLCKIQEKTRANTILGKDQFGTETTSGMTPAVLYFLETTDKAATPRHTANNVELSDTTTRAVAAARVHAALVNQESAQGAD